MAAGALTERYAANLHGVLSCYERIIVTGTGLGTLICGLQNAALVRVGECAPPSPRHDLAVAAGRDGRRRRFGRIFSRPTGSLRCARIGRNLHCVHRDLRLLVDRHTYLFAH